MKIAVRVNVDPDTGYGHIFRCLNLASRLQEEGDHVVFLTNPNKLVEEHETRLISSLVGSSEELKETAEQITDFEPEALILDIFPEEKRAPADYAKLIGFKGHTLSFVDSDDDFAPSHGLTINPNPLYRGHKIHPDCFHGLDYFLVNPDFHRSGHTADSVFISMGSVDEKNDLPEILKALSLSGTKKVDILASPFASYAKQIDEVFSNFSEMDIKWHEGVPSKELCRLINKAEFCITNGGNVMLEMMSLLKIVISIPSNDRLVQLTDWCAKRQGIIACRDISELQNSLVDINRFNPVEIIDGKGLNRIVDLIHRKK